MKLCEYGCGRIAKYKFKNGKYCCSTSYLKCPSSIKKYLTGKNHPMFGKKHSDDTKKQQSKKKIGDKNPCYWKNKKRDNRTKKQISKKITSLWNDPNSTFNTTDYKINFNNARKEKRYNIKFLKEKYPFFSKMEEMRYNPDNPNEKEIQVHCKNHLCENSKEKGGWFTPTASQIKNRKDFLEHKGEDKCYFYCSQECKNTCLLYNLHSDPYKKETEVPYTQEENTIWKSMVLEQDNYECQKCGSKEDLHCHHIHPVKTHPHLVLDLDNGITLCKDCHYGIGHKKGTECSTGKLANKQC